MKKIETKKAVVSFLVAAVVLVSVVGTASAVSITWYPTTNGTEVPAGANYWMTRGERSGQTEDFFWLHNTDSFIWSANESAQCDVSFCGAQWTVLLDLSGDGGECDGWLQSTETVTAKIGILDPDTGTFTEKCSGYKTGTGDSCSDSSSHSYMQISCPAFSVPQGNYLALQISMDNGEVQLDQTGSNTWLTSPTCGDPYPTPELPTLVLFGTGLLALAGFVLYNRRKEDRK